MMLLLLAARTGRRGPAAAPTLVAPMPLYAAFFRSAIAKANQLTRMELNTAVRSDKSICASRNQKWRVWRVRRKRRSPWLAEVCASFLPQQQTQGTMKAV